MKDKRLIISLTKEEKDAVKKLSQYYGLSASAVARQILIGKLSALQTEETTTC